MRKDGACARAACSMFGRAQAAFARDMAKSGGIWDLVHILRIVHVFRRAERRKRCLLLGLLPPFLAIALTG